MYKAVAVWAEIFVLSSLLSGCATTSGFFSSSDDRINAAFPVATEVQTGKTAALELATGAQQREFEIQFDAHLKQRAHNCAKDYSPSFFTSAEEIRSLLNNPACFADADKEITAWLGIKKVGLILAQPPLIPIPADKPSAITSNENILGIPGVADKASVALLVMSGEIGLIDLNTSKLLFHERKSGTPGPLSPNGRLFITGESDQLKIRDTLTGKVITEISGVLPWEFHWLDDRTAFYVDRRYKSFFIDFDSGETIATGMMNLASSKTVRLPDVSDQYAVLTGNKVSKFELVRSKVIPELKRLTEKALHLTGGGLATNTSGVTADGAYFFGASTHLTLVDLRSLESEEISLEPFQIQTSISSPDPDKIIITGFVQPHNGMTPPSYIYSISNRTLMPVSPANLNNRQRLVHIGSLGKLGRIEDNKIELMGELQTAETIPLASFIQNAKDTSEQNKIAIAERKIAQENSCRPTNEKNKDGIELHAIGIYEGPIHRGKYPSANIVDIKVYKSDQPIVLALFNYEPVVWNIKLDKGAKVREIIVNASEGTQLTGINEKTIKVSRQKFGYTADEDCQFFQMVAPKLKEFSGLNVTSFQGAYRGVGFPIRSNKTPPPIATDGKLPTTKHIMGLDDGLAAYEKGDYRTALDKLMPLAEKGVAMAQNTLGKMYMQGQGVPQDYDKAMRLFRKAAKKKLPNAQNNLGVMYAGGYGLKQDFKQAISWFKKAASQGYVIAIDNLADLYEKGVAVNQDPIEAERWRYESSKIKSGKGKFSEAVTIKLSGSDDYEKGLELYYGFKFKEALNLFFVAAGKGHPEAQLKLESMYRYGQGIEKNERRAKYWAKKAAAQGYSNDDSRDRIFVIDSSSEEGKKLSQPPPEPRAISVSAPSPTSVCSCTPGTPSNLCCTGKIPAGKSMEIKPE